LTCSSVATTYSLGESAAQESKKEKISSLQKKEVEYNGEVLEQKMRKKEVEKKNQLF